MPARRASNSSHFRRRHLEDALAVSGIEVRHHGETEVVGRVVEGRLGRPGLGSGDLRRLKVRLGRRRDNRRRRQGESSGQRSNQPRLARRSPQVSAHSKRAAPRFPETPPSEPDPLGDLSLQGRRELWVPLDCSSSTSDRLRCPRARKVRVTLSHPTPGSLLPASRPGRPVRRASVPLGKFRIAQRPAVRNVRSGSPCARTSARRVDGLWRTLGRPAKGRAKSRPRTCPQEP